MITMDSPFALTWANHNVADAEDYKRIRTRVVRRVHKLRKYLSIQQRKTKQYSHHSISAEDVGKDYKYWLIALLSLERDFCYAMELKSLSQLDAKLDTRAKHKLFLTRLKRSVQECDSLVQLVGGIDASSTNELELLVYREFINAQQSMALKQWDSAIAQLSLARVGLQFLEEHGNAENFGKYKGVIDSDIDSLLIGAIHKSSKNYSSDIGEVAKSVVSLRSDSRVYQLISSVDDSFLKPSGESKSVKELQWRSYTAKIKDDSLGRTLYKIQTCPLESMDDFDTLNNLISQASESHSMWLQNEIKEEDDEILTSYLQYTHVLTSLRRNVKLLGTVKPTEALTLLDKINQEVESLEEIPGVFNDDELYETLQGMKHYYNALKLKHIADFYFSQKQFKESLLLSSKVCESLEDVKISIPFEFINEDTVKELHAQVKTLVTNSQILAQLSQSSTSDSLADDVSRGLTRDSTIVNLNMTPISVKPVLFDIAFNYIHQQDQPQPQQQATPSVTKAQVGNEANSSDKKKGFFGIFGR